MRLFRSDLRWFLKAAVALAVAVPFSGWSQVMASPSAFAGVDASGNSTTVEASLRTMTAQAGVVFLGTVTQIRQIGGEGLTGSQGVVEISFAVEHGLRGASDGETYVLREWGGLWAAGGARYVVGNRFLMLLHAPGATGLSSPVGGADGIIPVRGSSSRITADGTTTATNLPVADLRWLAARLARPVNYRKPSSSQAAAQARTVTGASLHHGVGVVQPVAASTDEESAAARSASVPSAQASLGTVLEQMTSWSNGGNHVR